MQIVIDIEEAIYKECIPYKDTPITNLANYNSEIIHAIANGTPLPKGHGRLVDADAFTEVLNKLYLDGDNAGSFRGTDEETFIGKFQTIDELFNMPTIIEADKAESEDKLDGDTVDIDKVVEHYEGTLEVLKGIGLEVDG